MGVGLRGVEESASFFHFPSHEICSFLHLFNTHSSHTISYFSKRSLSRWRGGLLPRSRNLRKVGKRKKRDTRIVFGVIPLSSPLEKPVSN